MIIKYKHTVSTYKQIKIWSHTFKCGDFQQIDLNFCTANDDAQWRGEGRLESTIIKYLKNHFSFWSWTGAFLHSIVDVDIAFCKKNWCVYQNFGSH